MEQAQQTQVQAQQTQAKASVSASIATDAGAALDIKRIVEFCNKYNLNEERKRKSRVVHETDCVLTRYPERDVNCQCFRHKSYVVHGKWFFQ